MSAVKIILESDLPALEQLWRDIEREEHPEDSDAGDRAVLGSRRSLSEFNYLSSDSFWIFVSEAEHRFVGYASAARIPKADARVGLLYVDELYVLSEYRRQGHAMRIMEAALAHALSLRLEGVRLLVDPENTAARRFYERLGLVERHHILCER